MQSPIDTLTIIAVAKKETAKAVRDALPVIEDMVRKEVAEKEVKTLADVAITLKGDKGDKGDDGKDGADGVDGKDGQDGTNGLDGKRGPKGQDGKDGLDGRNGTDGKDGRNGKDGSSGADGRSVVDAKIADNGHLLIGLTDGEVIDAGMARGKPGKDGKDGLVKGVLVTGAGGGSGGEGGPVAWGDVTDKPTEFPPSAHTHPTSDVTGLDDALVDLQDQIDDLDSEIAAKQDALVSGTNIKTVGGFSILGAGDIAISSTTVISNTDTGARNDWAPSGLGADTVVYWAGTSSLLVTGIDTTTLERLEFRNSAANRIAVFALSNTGSSSANRLSVESRDPVRVLPGETAVFRHNGTDWIVVQNSSGGPRSFWNYKAVLTGQGSAYTNIGTLGFTNGGSAATSNPAAAGTHRSGALQQTWGTGASAGTNTGFRTNSALAIAGYSGAVGEFNWGALTIPSTAETWFAGFGNGSVAPSNIDASARTNQVGWGLDPAATRNVHLMHNDGSGTSTATDLGSDYAWVVDNMFGGLIWQAPGSTEFSTAIWRRDDPTVTPVVVDITSDQMAANTLIQPIIWLNNRAAAVSYAITSHKPLEFWSP